MWPESPLLPSYILQPSACSGPWDSPACNPCEVSSAPLGRTPLQVSVGPEHRVGARAVLGPSAALPSPTGQCLYQWLGAMPLSLMSANTLSFHNDLTFSLTLQILVEHEVCSRVPKMCVWITWDLKLKFLVGLQISQCPLVKGAWWALAKGFHRHLRQRTGASRTCSHTVRLQGEAGREGRVCFRRGG